MAQLWLTYSEIAEEFGGDQAQVRNMVIALGWTRRRSRDGLTRVMMPTDLMQRYFALSVSRMETMKAQTDAMVAGLRLTSEKLQLSNVPSDVALQTRQRTA